MNTCPYSHDSVACSLLSSEASGSMAYCKQCSQFAFQCVDGHWNRTFARFCTQCSKELKKPANWEMASANPQRTATFLEDLSNGTLGLNSGVISIPTIESGENLPQMLVIDGLILLPNPCE